MKELYLKGYVNKDDENDVVLQKELNNKYWEGISIREKLVSMSKSEGDYRETDKGLGGYVAKLYKCNLRIYYTDKECDLTTAMLTVDNKLFGDSDVYLEVEYEGYSEYTITGIDIREFMIGGHDLREELLSHKDKYCHFILEVG